MTDKFERGTRVYVVTDATHVGTVEETREDQTRVRWHKGYATWESTYMLRAV